MNLTLSVLFCVRCVGLCPVEMYTTHHGADPLYPRAKLIACVVLQSDVRRFIARAALIDEEEGSFRCSLHFIV